MERGWLAEVGPQRAERLCSLRAGVGMRDEGVLGRVGVIEDATDDGRVGDLLEVVLSLDRRVQHVAQEGETEAEEKAQHQAEGDVAARFGADRCRVDLSGAHQGDLDRAGLACRHLLQLLDRGWELLPEGVGDSGCLLGAGVGDGDVDEDRVKWDSRGHPLSHLVGRRVQLELVDHRAEHLRGFEQLGV